MNFLVGASRLGYLSVPVWCPTNELVNVSLFGNSVAGNTLENEFLFFVKFDATKNLKAYGNLFGHFGCESR
jgi:hypothetical protein